MPLPKETINSARSYFVFAAILSPLPWDDAIYHGISSTLAPVPWFLNMTVAVLFITIAIRFEKLLRKPTLIKGVLAVSVALTAISLALALRSGVQGHIHIGDTAGGGISFAVSLRSGVPVSSVARLILSLLVSVYLLKYVAQLSKEVAPRIA